jgi:hypothetical protein
MVILRILMSTFGFKEKGGLVKLIVGVVKHVTINELKLVRPVDYHYHYHYHKHMLFL